MKNGSKFIYFVCFIGAYIISVISILNPDCLNSFDILDIAFQVVIAWMILFVLEIVLCWLNNLTSIIFWKHKKYSFISIYFFPFIFIKSNKKKCKHCSVLVAFTSIFSMVSLKKLENNDSEIDNYEKNNQSCMKCILAMNIVLMCIFGSLSYFELKIAIALCSFLAATMVLNSMKISKFTLPFLYAPVSLKDSEQYIIYQNLQLEDFDKTAIYKRLQTKTKKLTEERNLSLNSFWEQILFDSICDKKKYLNEESYQSLSKLFLEANYSEQQEYIIELIRVFKLYYIYLHMFYGESKSMMNCLEMNISVILQEADHNPLLKNKILGQFSNGEQHFYFLGQKLDVRNEFDIYVKKLTYISNCGEKIK